MGADSLDGQENGEGTGPRVLSVGRTQAPGPQVSGPCLPLPPIAPRSRLWLPEGLVSVLCSCCRLDVEAVQREDLGFRAGQASGWFWFWA